MCVGIGLLVFIFPLIAIVSAFLGYRYGKRVLDAIEFDDQT